MYRFDRPIDQIARRALRIAKSCATETVENYPIYTACVPYAIGNLRITCGQDYYGVVYVNVIAQLNDDPTRNSTIAGGPAPTVEAIAFAIGFTCGAAMFRSPSYQNQ